MKLNKENADINYLYFLVLILGLSSYFVYKISFNETEITYKLLGTIVLYFFIYMILVILLSRLNHPIVKKLLNLLGLPLGLIMYLQYLIAPIITALMFFAFYMVPISFILMVIDVTSIGISFKMGIVYLTNVLAILVYAYFGNYIMKFIIFTMNPVLRRESLNKYSTVLYMRILSYAIMVIIYLFYNIIEFSNKEEFLVFRVEQLSVIKEVLVTFVAVDTLIQIIIKWRSEEKSKH